MRELSLNILDIVTNSIEAEATRVITVIEELSRENLFRIRIRDNGRGMSEEMCKKVLDPFVTSRTTRAVGMGLPMLHQQALQSGGNVTVQSTLGQGTTVTAEFKNNNLDRAPLGNMADTVVNLVIGSLDVHFYYIHLTTQGRFCFDSYWMLGRTAEKECSLYDMVEPAKEYIRQKLLVIGSRG